MINSLVIINSHNLGNIRPQNASIPSKSKINYCCDLKSDSKLPLAVHSYDHKVAVKQ